MKYYHISPIENKESILATGLKSNEGIFLFTQLEQAIHIASNQIGINEYSIFKIDKSGMTGKLEHDGVAELGSKYQYILDQELVEAKYVKHIKDESLNVFDMINESEANSLRAMGQSEEQIIEMMCNYPDRVARYNEVHGTNHKHNKV